VTWDIELTEHAENWYMGLSPADADQISAALDKLEEDGPNLGRPFVDSIKTSRHHNMKELRSVGGFLPMLFAFDPRRTAVVLLGGDKRHDWNGWYDRNIPIADEIYDNHLKMVEEE
jgi:hypothetical protein